LKVNDIHINVPKVGLYIIASQLFEV